MKTAFQKYHKFLSEVKNLSETTISSYERDIVQFQNFLDCNLKKATKNQLINYLEQKRRKGCSNSTISRNMVSLRSFFSYLENIGMIKKDPTKSLEMPHIEKHLPQILTESEITILLEGPHGDDAKALRDKAMLELLYATGIKVSELTSLNVSNINLRRGMLILNSRVVPLGKVAQKALNVYLKNGRTKLIKGTEETALFVNYNGKRMTRQGFWKLIKHYKESTGIEKEITPHTLRHSFAAHLLKNGADIDIIGEMMGLSDSASTAVYKKIIENRLFDEYKKAHPRA